MAQEYDKYGDSSYSQYPTDDKKYECRTGPFEGFFVSSVEFCKHNKFDDKKMIEKITEIIINRKQGPPGPAGPQAQQVQPGRKGPQEPTGPQDPSGPQEYQVHKVKEVNWSNRNDRSSKYCARATR